MNAIKTIKAIEISCFVQVPLCAWLCFVVPELAIPIAITSLAWLGSVLLWQDLRWYLIERRDHKKFMANLETLNKLLLGHCKDDLEALRKSYVNKEEKKCLKNLT